MQEVIRVQYKDGEYVIIGSESETNEEWFSGMYTEAKAEWLADHMKCSKCPQQNRCNGYHGGCVALMLEWLKQPHTNEETK